MRRKQPSITVISRPFLNISSRPICHPSLNRPELQFQRLNRTMELLSVCHNVSRGLQVRSDGLPNEQHTDVSGQILCAVVIIGLSSAWLAQVKKGVDNCKAGYDDNDCEQLESELFGPVLSALKFDAFAGAFAIIDAAVALASSQFVSIPWVICVASDALCAVFLLSGGIVRTCPRSLQGENSCCPRRQRSSCTRIGMATTDYARRWTCKGSVTRCKLMAVSFFLAASSLSRLQLCCSSRRGSRVTW